MIIALATGVTSCGGSVFQCSGSDECGDGGLCEPNGYCSFADDDCESGRRYGSLAGDLGHMCVPTDGETESTTTTTMGSSATMPSSSTEPGTSLPAMSMATTDDPSGTSTLPGTTTGLDDSGTSMTAAEDTATTDPPTSTGQTMVTETFGERSGADHQNVSEDTTISVWSPTSNTGAHADIHVHGNAEHWEVGLLRFDVAALPDGADVVSVELQVWTVFDAADGEISAHEVTQPWTEGSGDFGVDGVCNWTEATSTDTWVSEGAGTGSYNPTPMGTFSTPALDTEYTLDLDPDVIEGWNDDPSSNHGFLLRTEEMPNPVNLASREFFDESLRPILVVTYLI